MKRKSESRHSRKITEKNKKKTKKRERFESYNRGFKEKKNERSQRLSGTHFIILFSYFTSLWECI